MPTVSYLLYDVFTDTPFAGNPLAVAIDPPPLTDEQMLTMANELNLSETVYMWPSADGSVHTRIFTPGGELPFAGHPTIGAAIALVESDVVKGPVELDEKVGLVVVEVDPSDDVTRATLTTPVAPTAVDVADPDDIARSLGLRIDDLHQKLGPRGWSCGVPYTVVAVRDVETLGRSAVDASAWRDTVALSDAPEYYVIAPVDPDQPVDARSWRARMFAPGVGIAEDPATGSAAAALVGYLAGHASPSRLTEGWTIDQGVEMGRPSRIEIGAVLDGSELVAATVGGGAVRVGRGELDLL